MLTTKPRAARIVSFAAAAIALFCGATVQAQTTLRWKFKEGETLKYVMEQKMTMKMNVNGMDIETTMNQTTDLSWSVKAVDKDGVADMVQTIDRFRMKMESLAFAFEFDSKDEKNPEGPVGELIGPIFRAMAGAEFALKMDQRGKIKDVKIPEKLLSAFQNNPALAQFGGMFTEDGLKQMTQGGSGSVGELPEEPVSKGKSWEHKAEMKSPFGTMKMETTNTYAGSETRGGSKVEKIDMKVAQTFEAPAGGQFEIRMKSQDAKGAAYFDNSSGRMLETELKQKMQIEIEAMGNVLVQDVDAVITVKLAKGDAAKKTN